MKETRCGMDPAARLFCANMEKRSASGDKKARPMQKLLHGSRRGWLNVPGSAEDQRGYYCADRRFLERI